MRNKFIGTAIGTLLVSTYIVLPASATSTSQPILNNTDKSKPLPPIVMQSVFKQLNNISDPSFPVLHETEPNDDPLKLKTPLSFKKVLTGKFQSSWDDDLFKIQSTHSAFLYIAGRVSDESKINIGLDLYDTKYNYIEPIATVVVNDMTVSMYPSKSGAIYYLDVYEPLGRKSGSAIYGIETALVYPKTPTANKVTDYTTQIYGIADAGNLVTATIHGKLLTKTHADPTGKYSMKIPKLKGGTFLSIISYDTSGHPSDTKSVKVIDTVPPAPPYISKVDDNDHYIKGKSEPGAMISILHGKKTIGTGKVSHTGTFSIKIKPLKAGTVLSVIAADTAHNTSKPKHTTVIDRTPPLIKKLYAVSSHSTSVKGITEPFAKIYVKHGIQIIGSGKADHHGMFHAHIKKQHHHSRLAIYAKDKAGNKSHYKYLNVK